MKIKLTEEQIETLVKAEKEKLIATHSADVEKLQKKLDKDIAGLIEKYSTYEITIGTSKGTRIKYNETQITNLYLSDKSISDIATALNYPMASTRAKIYKMVKDGKLKKRIK